MAFKFNPLTGQLDIVGEGGASVQVDNFSYTQVVAPITVPENQQMVFEGPIVVDDTLTVDGSITQIQDYSDWGFSWNTILANQAVRVPANRDMIVLPGLIIDGLLAIDGRLIEI